MFLRLLVKMIIFVVAVVVKITVIALVTHSILDSGPDPVLCSMIFSYTMRRHSEVNFTKFLSQGNYWILEDSRSKNISQN